VTTPLQSNAQAVVLHFWAHWCAPCVRDFEIYAALQERIPRKLGKVYGLQARQSRVQFLYLAEDTPTTAMRAFLARNASLQLGSGNYQDSGEQLMKSLQRRLGLYPLAAADAAARPRQQSAGRVFGQCRVAAGRASRFHSALGCSA
jgi:thiol-disulfide isomerase/thioredoxin